MRYFVVARSNPAPIFSDESLAYVDGVDPFDALAEFMRTYGHLSGLASADLYASADDYHLGCRPLADWRA